MTKTIVDVGELGWSLYLVFYYNWLKARGEDVTVYCDPSRLGLYGEGLPIKIPGDKDCFGVQGKDITGEIRKKFPGLAHTMRNQIEKGVAWKDETDKMIPTRLKVRKSIIVFPRFREGIARNLTRKFYEELVERLCQDYKENRILTFGVPSGSYQIENSHPNYFNLVSNWRVEDLLVYLTSCRVALGSQSAPPKIALLQGVPTFMIGHEKNRHVEIENWMKTPAGFYETSDYKVKLSQVYPYIKEFIDAY